MDLKKKGVHAATKENALALQILGRICFGGRGLKPGCPECRLKSALHTDVYFRREANGAPALARIGSPRIPMPVKTGAHYGEA